MQPDVIEEKRFLDYRLDIWPERFEKRYSLVQGKKEIPAFPRTLKLLAALLSYPAKTKVPRQHLVDAVWGEHTLVDNLDRQMCMLRGILKNTAHNKRPFITTYPKAGYSFLVRVTQTTRPLDPPVEPPNELEGDTDVKKAFDQFFGISKPDDNGIIILQSDTIDDVLKDHTASALIQPSSRLWKARRFANAWDAFAGIAIQQEFQNQGRKTPTLVLSDHRIGNTPDIGHALPAFSISMGLGFTHETSTAIEGRVFDPWMRISRNSDFEPDSNDAVGDAVCFHEKLIPSRDKNPRLGTVPYKPGSHFLRLIPSDWSESYVDSWFEMLPPAHGRAVQDYAIILRHTRQVDSHRQIIFVVAGFTERGTAIAGQYLAKDKNWQALWRTYVNGRPYGDFLIVIEGPSDPRRMEEWSEVKQYEVIPERLLKRKISCEWAHRARKKPT